MYLVGRRGLSSEVRFGARDSIVQVVVQVCLSVNSHCSWRPKGKVLAHNHQIPRQRCPKTEPMHHGKRKAAVIATVEHRNAEHVDA